ncbi:hypothetical protein BKA61DRAFT_682829 [Leptodontidium sp. MPI-SDFR-AT-0119]|nr:hypothetical protein BKA61DRAFT_682829 [Leptodontidium sp. MPI-SDFR-AT-0119]
MFSFLLAFFFLLLGTVSSQSVSLQYVSAYASQRTCASTCQAINAKGPPDILAENLHCATDPIDNSCFCRTDMQPSAENYLQTCVQRFCSNTLDASSAVSIYDAYCTSAGFVKAAITTAATTTGTAQGPSATSTSTNTGSNTDSSGSSSSGTTYGGLSKAELIGTIVACVGVLVSAIGAYYGWRALRRHRTQF